VGPTRQLVDFLKVIRFSLESDAVRRRDAIFECDAVWSGQVQSGCDLNFQDTRTTGPTGQYNMCSLLAGLAARCRGALFEKARTWRGHSSEA
jgi:hypothetical protein